MEDLKVERCSVAANISVRPSVRPNTGAHYEQKGAIDIEESMQSCRDSQSAFEFSALSDN